MGTNEAYPAVSEELVTLKMTPLIWEILMHLARCLRPCPSIQTSVPGWVVLEETQCLLHSTNFKP